MELDSSTTKLIASGSPHDSSISRARDPQSTLKDEDLGVSQNWGYLSGVPILKMNVFGLF